MVCSKTPPDMTMTSGSAAARKAPKTKRGARLKEIFCLSASACIIIILIALGQRLADKRGGWRTDFDKSTIDMAEVISGGVPRDGIPPIDAPQFQPVRSVKHLATHSPLIAVKIKGEARGYPLEVLIRHEIVNDVLADIPIAITFCPLCNSAVVFDRRVDGAALRFGVSGNLRYSDLIMWDDITESWWQQLTGEAIVGAYSGYQLNMIASQLISFGVFRERYPQGEILRGPLDKYGQNPYPGYDSSASPFLFRGQLDARLRPTERALAGLVAGQAVAYAFSELEQHQVLNDKIAGEDIVVFWQAGAVSALDTAEIDTSRAVGMALMYSRQLEGGEVLTFCQEAAGIQDEETGSLWNIFGEAIAGPLKGSKLRQLPAAAHFWFAWAAFYPETELRDVAALNQAS